MSNKDNAQKNSNGQTFDEWMAEVDAAVQRIAFLSVHDLPDQTFYDWFESDYTPDEAAAETLEDAGYPEELL